MEVKLLADVPKLGEKGQFVRVTKARFRNELYPKQVALYDHKVFISRRKAEVRKRDKREAAKLAKIEEKEIRAIARARLAEQGKVKEIEGEVGKENEVIQWEWMYLLENVPDLGPQGTWQRVNLEKGLRCVRKNVPGKPYYRKYKGPKEFKFMSLAQFRQLRDQQEARKGKAVKREEAYAKAVKSAKSEEPKDGDKIHSERPTTDPSQPFGPFPTEDKKE